MIEHCRNNIAHCKSCLCNVLCCLFIKCFALFRSQEHLNAERKFLLPYIILLKGTLYSSIYNILIPFIYTLLFAIFTIRQNLIKQIIRTSNHKLICINKYLSYYISLNFIFITFSTSAKS